jgi:hypothetical protein
MILLRILLHAAIIAGALNLIGLALKNQGVPLASVLLDWLSPGWYCIFALTVACLINQRPLVLVALLGLGFLLGYQAVSHELGGLALAIFLGVLAARGLRALAFEAAPEEDI